MPWLFKLVIIIFSTHSLLAEGLRAYRQELTSQMILADRYLSNSFEQLSLEYTNRKFSLPLRALCFSELACARFSDAQADYQQLINSDHTENVLSALVIGFVAARDDNEVEAPSCVADDGENAALNQQGFTDCLVADSPHELVIEVRFKSFAEMPKISPALAGKKILFRAFSSGIDPCVITFSDTSLPMHSSIGSFHCKNVQGSVGDGLNNGQALGSILLQGQMRTLDVILPNQSTFGGLQSCLSNSE